MSKTPSTTPTRIPSVTPASDVILGTLQLGFPWQTADPFLFCVHHLDHYPAGNEVLGPNASLVGRNIGQDFTLKDGWRMYHGDTVPGFPSHPHRGFETITLVRRGYIDHSDSLGARARFGHGDCQWMTAGRGIVHAEMFPLLKRDEGNTVELFQIWLNLPASDKLVDPYFTMLWAEDIPQQTFWDAEDREIELTVVAGAFEGLTPPPPPPSSWASRPEAEVAVWTVRLAPHARWTLPGASPGLNRTLYFHQGLGLEVAGQRLAKGVGVQVRSEAPVDLVNGAEESEVLVLQGRPIGEPVARYGPFVMNTQAELRQAYFDYEKDRFGGWPWERRDPTHGRSTGRFAKHIDGRLEKPV